MAPDAGGGEPRELRVTPDPGLVPPPGVTVFSPDWTIAPAAVLAAWLAESKMTVAALAEKIVQGNPPADGWSEPHVTAALRAVLRRAVMAASRARLLEAGTGISREHWKRLEGAYRAGLAAGRRDVTPVLDPEAM
jgi:hypothetical protein